MKLCEYVLTGLAFGVVNISTVVGSARQLSLTYGVQAESWW